MRMDVGMATNTSEEARFRSLFDANYDNILRYCIRRLPTADANDAASEVFTIAWRRSEALPDEEAKLWLYGIARNVVRNFQRSARRSRRLAGKIAGLAPEVVDGPERQVVTSDELRHTLATLDRLRPDDQEILRLRAMERLTIAEIASVLNCSEEAARKRFERAAKRLQNKVGSPVPTPAPIPCDPNGEVTA
jgi:RNA polymerase sigma-70 factor (ECF subfamily)